MTKILENSKQEYSQIALAKARQLYGSQPCSTVCGSYKGPSRAQSSSQALAASAACPLFTRPLPLSERVRLSNLQQANLDAAPRFSEFNRFFPPGCPPVDPVVLNAFLPKASTACPLPNTVLNPAGPV